ncbi:MAG: alpha/beta hydrolase [Actinomycetota bacterium]
MTAGPAARGTSLLEGPNGAIELITTGSGLPATVFAHGVSGSIQSTRPFGSGVMGSRTFFHFRGYGASAPAATPLTYSALEADLRAVANHVGATQALGVSMGAGALCALLAVSPLRFERLVFTLPAALDRPRTDKALEGVELAAAAPLTDRAVLRAVIAPALVIAQEQDPEHPVWVAEQLAASLPNARLEVLAPGGILVRHRAAMRELIGGFLNGATPSTVVPSGQHGTM